MRLWSLHPKYLDVKGLTAVWREALLAQSVLRGQRTAYSHHPQLRRFRAQPDPGGAVAEYLRSVADEADRRGYHFDRSRIGPGSATKPLLVTRGQLLYEWWWLKSKLAKRDPRRLAEYSQVSQPDVHPLFRVVPGEVEEWEKRHDQDERVEDNGRTKQS